MIKAASGEAYQQGVYQVHQAGKKFKQQYRQPELISRQRDQPMGNLGRSKTVAGHTDV